MKTMRGSFAPEPCALCGAALDAGAFCRWRCYRGGTWAREGYWALCPRCSERMRLLLNRERERRMNDSDGDNGLLDPNP